MMAPLSDRSSIFGDERGCAFHGDEELRECVACGREFCAACNPHTVKCPDCLEHDFEEPDDDEDESDEEEYNDLVDDEAEARIEEADRLPSPLEDGLEESMNEEEMDEEDR